MGVPHFGSHFVKLAYPFARLSYWRGSSKLLGQNGECASVFQRTLPSAHHPLPYICNFLEMQPEKFMVFLYV